jgi:hypothetical protein
MAYLRLLFRRLYQTIREQGKLVELHAQPHALSPGCRKGLTAGRHRSLVPSLRASARLHELNDSH